MSKYAEYTDGQKEAIFNMIGGKPVIDRMLTGELTARLIEPAAATSAAPTKPEIVIEPSVRSRFDRHGIRIPPKGFKAEVVAADRSFTLRRVRFNLKARLSRIVRGFPGMTFPTLEAFLAQVQAITGQIQGDGQLAKLLRGVCIPLCLPRLQVSDYGTVLDTTFLTAVGQAYTAQFPNRAFYNNVHGALAGKVGIVPESRHQTLLERMAAGPVVGLYFPACLQGFSIPADREQMVDLPPWLTLSGGLDIATALVAYPDILARDYQVPCLDMAALTFGSAEESLYAYAGGDSLDVNGRYLGAIGHASGGLLALGR